VLLHSWEAREHQVARMRRQLFGETLEIRPRLVGTDDSLQRTRRVAAQDSRDGLRDDASVQGSERLYCLCLGDLVGASVRGEELVEQAQRVAHRAQSLSGAEGQRSVVDANVLRLGDLAKPRGDLSERNELEIVPLHAGEN